MITAEHRTRKKSNSTRYFFCPETTEAACSACQVKIVSGSLLYHVSMTLIKAVVGVITGSKVLVAEAIHSFSDCAAFGINYFGVRTNRVSVLDQSVLIGAIMFLSGVWICADNLAIIISRVPAHPGLFALIVAMISIIVNWHLYMVSSCTHRRDPKNGNVFMFMVQNQTNLYAACCGFIGILLAVLGLVYFDPIGAIFIGCFQIYGSWQIFAECFEKQRAKLAVVKRRVSIALGVAALGIVFMFTCNVLGTFSRRNVVLIPSEGPTIDSPASSLLGRARYFCIFDLGKNTTSINENRARYYNVQESRILGATVKNNGVGIILAGKVGPRMFASLRDSGIRIYYFEGLGTVAGVLSDYQSGRLKLAASANSTTGFGRSQVSWLGPW